MKKNKTIKAICIFILMLVVLTSCGSQEHTHTYGKWNDCGEYQERHCEECGYIERVYYDSGVVVTETGKLFEGNETDSEDDTWPSVFKKPGKDNTTIKKNQTFTSNQDNEYLGIYTYDGNLTVEEGVQLTSDNISQLVLIVNGTLTMKKGSSIRVRNGFYEEAPVTKISSLNDDTISSFQKNSDNIVLFPGIYGKGGNGGNGGDGFNGYSSGGSFRAGGNAGGAGGGGFGGGVVGTEGKSGSDGFSSHQRQQGWASGGRGITGKSNNVGNDGSNSNEYSGSPGDGNGGNAGYSGYSKYQAISGLGGGGGGYGGGVLSIYAKKIVIEDDETPAFVVLGQYGGLCGYAANNAQTTTTNGAQNGQNGEGGLLYIQAEEYEYNESHWVSSFGRSQYTNPIKTVEERTSLKTVYTGGHSSLVACSPQKVFINGKLIDEGPSNDEIYGTSSNSTSGSSYQGGGTSQSATHSLPCEFCKQTGKLKCSACDGTGKVWGNLGKNKVNCTICSGTGKRKCYYCNGDGIWGN